MSGKHFYYSTESELKDISEHIRIGDCLMNLPYVEFPKFMSLLWAQHTNVDYLYGGQNLIIFSLS